MKKILIIIVLVLFLSSCTLPFGQQAQPSTGRGIKLEFLDYPKGELDEQEPFTIRLRLTNNAPYDLDGTLCLSDVVPDRFGGIPDEECRDVNLPGAVKIEDYFEPQIDIYDFPSEIGYYFYKDLKQDITQTTSISSILRYAIDTKSSAQVCIKNPRLEGSNLPSHCKNDYTINKINQPETPIEVTKIEQKSSALASDQIKLTFTIYLEQTEDGILINKQDIFETISPETKVEFSAGFYNGQNFECAPVIDRKIDFREKQKVIKCKTIYSLGQEYIEEPIVVNLGYGFQKTAAIPEIELKAEETF